MEMCQGLTYNLTSFPNIWLSIADQREAATLLQQYRVKATLTIHINQPLLIAAILRSLHIFAWKFYTNLLHKHVFLLFCHLNRHYPVSLCIVAQVLMELACFEPLRRLVCGIFLPQCSPQGGVLQPCRSACTAAEQQCSQVLDLFSFSWPFNCHLLPDSQDPMECSLP